MPRTTRRPLTRLERLEAKVRPGDRCEVCGGSRGPVAAIVFVAPVSCRTPDHRPLKRPSGPPCPGCGVYPDGPFFEVWEDEVEPQTEFSKVVHRPIGDLWREAEKHALAERPDRDPEPDTRIGGQAG